MRQAEHGKFMFNPFNVQAPATGLRLMPGMAEGPSVTLFRAAMWFGRPPIAPTSGKGSGGLEPGRPRVVANSDALLAVVWP